MLTLLVCLCAFKVFATPGLFRATVVFGAWGPGVAVFFLATILVGLGLEFKPSKKLRAARIGSALLCAILLTLAAAVSAETDPATVPAWAEAILKSAPRRPRPGRCCSRRCTAPERATSEAGAAHRQRGADRRQSDRSCRRAYLMEDRLAAAAFGKADASASRLALLFIDLDGFKPVNDTYGHSIGDIVLEQVGQRLKAMLVQGEDVVARVGGDEFLLLLSNVTTQEGIAHVADRLIQGLSQPYQAEGREVMISCLVGIAIYPTTAAATPS